MTQTDSIPSRRCSTCRLEKPLPKFPPHQLKHRSARCKKCDNAAQNASYANRHSPLRKSPRLKLYRRIMDKVRIDRSVVWNGTPCWLWTGHVDTKTGYATFWFEGSSKIAHRVVYQVFIEIIPRGHLEMPLDHLCRVRHCVSPMHLEIVTPKINTMRGDTLAARNAAKTHCKNGHEFTPENTYIPPPPYSCRQCRKCRNANIKKYPRTVGYIERSKAHRREYRRGKKLQHVAT